MKRNHSKCVALKERILKCLFCIFWTSPCHLHSTEENNTSTTEIACVSPVPINTANSLKMKIIIVKGTYLKLWLWHFLNIRWTDTWLSLKSIWCFNFHDLVISFVCGNV